MTTDIPPVLKELPGQTGQPGSRWELLDAVLDEASQWLNPILVKEARQALKSRQFVITFSLLLLAGLIWSLIGVVTMMPAIYYAPSGRVLLTGYYVILTVPMLLIVPFSAYRSLAGEREDGTYELLSITTLTARQIVTGKLGSAVLQMLIYYSALSPCIAFTYMLRGVDIVTIICLLGYSFLVSLLLTSIGLLCGTASRRKHMQVLISVALLIGLLIATVTWWSWSAMFINEGLSMAFAEPELWAVQGALVSMGLSYVALFVLAAATQLSFASDNRSTKLRWILVIQQMMFAGWMSYFWVVWGDEELLYMLLGFSAAHWLCAGAVMTGEWPHLSPRVRRELPQSLLGRMFLTWFNPGSGTGYILVVCTMAAVATTTAALSIFGEAIGSTTTVRSDVLGSFALLLWGYLTVYLGVGRLILLWLRRWFLHGVALPLLIQILLLVAGVGIPLLLQSWLMGYRDIDVYTALQIPNWWWTIAETIDGNGTVLAEASVVLVTALIVLAVNMVVAAKEVEQVRLDAPERVLQDDMELHPERVPVKMVPRDPFADED
jgi:ABC-type transport system involved in multi-copper enzyme maturation permease subunit